MFYTSNMQPSPRYTGWWPQKTVVWSPQHRLQFFLHTTMSNDVSLPHPLICTQALLLNCRLSIRSCLSPIRSHQEYHYLSLASLSKIGLTMNSTTSLGCDTIWGATVSLSTSCLRTLLDQYFHFKITRALFSGFALWFGASWCVFSGILELASLTPIAIEICSGPLIWSWR